MRSMVEGAPQARCVESSLPESGAWAWPPPTPEPLIGPAEGRTRLAGPSFRRIATEGEFACLLRGQSASRPLQHEEVVCEQPS